MPADHTKSTRVQVIPATTKVPETMSEFKEAKRQLVQETKEKRMQLLQSLDFLWLSSELHKQYAKADEADDVRAATNVLSVLAEKLKLFERAEASRLQLKAEKWSANDLLTVQMDLLKNAVECGNLPLATRILETMKKTQSKDTDLVNYEAQLAQLLNDSTKE